MQANNGSALLLSDGRTLSYAEYGEPAGKPVFVFHGTPGSRFLAKAFDQAASARGVRIVAPERPGYGLSSPHRGKLIDYPDDVLQLADALGWNSLPQSAFRAVERRRWPAPIACPHA